MLRRELLRTTLVLVTVLTTRTRAQDCPPDVPVALCFDLPCNLFSCPNFPDATCTNNYCGGCNAIYSDAATGVEIPDFACRNPTNNCPNGVPIASCFRGVCDEATCPGVPDATCRIGCNCEAVFSDSEGRDLSTRQCNPGDPVRPDPRCPTPTGLSICIECPPHCPRGQICCPNSCGSSCIPVPDDDIQCSPDEIAYCFARPCSVTSCPGVPDATCTDNYCGGCNAIFTDSYGRELTDQQCNPVSGGCPPGVPIFNCLVSPCSVNSCPGVPDATCTDNFCGGCNAIFTDSDGDELTDEQCNPGGCPPGVPIFNCLVSPCSVNSCPGVPDATCTDNFCGGCNAIFTDSDGDVLTDAQCNPVRTCPPLVNPAAYVNYAYRCTNRNNVGSICHITCRRRYHLVGVSQVKCLRNGQWSKSLENTSCRAGYDPRCPARRYGFCLRQPTHCGYCFPGYICCPNRCGSACVRAPTPVRTCPSPYTSGASYSLDCSNGQRVGSVCDVTCPDTHELYGITQIRCQSNGRWDESLGSTQCIRRIICPPGSPQARCAFSHCKRASCPAHPNAQCVEDYCGGCNYNFYLNGNRLSRQECIPRDQCIISRYCPDVCSGETCGGQPDAICKADCYCHPRFYDPLTLNRVYCYTLFNRV